MIEKLWNMVNSAKNLNDVKIAELEINKSDIDNKEYDELMMALSYISRELYR